MTKNVEVHKKSLIWMADILLNKSAFLLLIWQPFNFIFFLFQNFNDFLIFRSNFITYTMPVGDAVLLWVSKVYSTLFLFIYYFKNIFFSQFNVFYFIK